MNLYKAAQPLIGCLDAENAHHLALWALKHGLVMAPAQTASPLLSQQLWRLSFANPVGIAAGFDKNAQAVLPLMRLGFGFVEVGTLTPRPQSGNPRPRLFRLTPDKAVINRLGFNNEGAARAAARLVKIRGENALQAPLGINIGANKDSIDRSEDYQTSLSLLYESADYVTINISSPNTPGLRDLQEPEALSQLIAKIVEMRARLAVDSIYKPLLLKIAPDMSGDAACAIADIARTHGIDGLIVSNTTLARPPLKSAKQAEAGGLSGAPLFAPSTKLLAAIYLHVGDSLPLIGVGGVSNAREAYEKIRAGARLVQLYSALVFEGPSLVSCITKGLEKYLKADGHDHISKAVGVGAYDWAHNRMNMEN